MDRSATWKGNRFWHNHDREGHVERLQALTHKTIFPSGPGADVIATGRSGDIIPVPDLLDREWSSITSQAHGFTPSDIKVESCPPLKLDIEALHSVSRGRSSSTSMSPIDMRIAELEASIVTERASRLSASQRILSNLRPELGCRISSLTNKSGISRLPLEITRKIVGFIEFRRDIAALACVSKSWREETLQALYSTIVLRGWDQIMSCLATVSSGRSIANRVTDLTLDTGSWPAALNHQFYSIVTDALDKTRNLRRLVLILDSDITLGYDISTVLEHCRFRLHHFVYEGPDALQCLETFLDFQTMIRTLQVPHRATPGRFSLILPPYTTQLWLPFLVHTHGCRYRNLENLSHLSLKGEIAHLALDQFRHSPIHYLAHDLAPWIASRMMLPEWFPTLIPDVFSNLRILRLVGYWVTCATDGVIAPPQQPTTTNPPPETSQWADADAFNLSAAIQPFTIADPDNPLLGIGSYLNTGQGEVDKFKAPVLRIEPAFLEMLRHLPYLQALEVGGFVVRDAGRLRTQTGNAEYWLSNQRTQWEEDFINCVTSRAAKNLVIVSFLACDKSLYLSAFPNAPSSAGDTHCLWSSYLEKARSKEALDAESSGTTLFQLMAQTSLQRWSGSACEPSSRCDYNVDSSFVPSKTTRDLAEEVVMNEWINKGDISGWEKRVNIKDWGRHPLLSPPTSSFRLSLTLHILSRSFLRFKYKPVLDTLKTQEHDINMPPSASYYPGRVHPASLIPVSEHHPEFLWLMNQRVTEEMVDHIVSKTCTTIPLASDAYTPRRRPVPAHSALPSPPVTPTKPGFQADADRKDVSEDQGIESLPSLEAFLKNIVTSSKVQAPTLLCTLIYLDRIQPRLPPLDPSAPHSRSRDVRYRVLLATIICAAKYLNDSSPKNKHWAAYSSSMFHCEDVNAMETQLLDLLGWELRLTEEECVRTFSVFFKKSPEGRAYQPPSPQEESDISSSALRSGSQLLVPANRRASRPARIEVSTGPAHLHSSYSRAQVSAAPLSPPPSAVNSTFSQSRCPPASDVAVVEETGKLGPIKPLLLPRRNGSYSHNLDSQERSSQGVRSLIPTRSSSTQRPSEAGAEKCSVDSSISWPSLSRANGILERVWGSAAQNGRDSVRSSRSVGGVFRAASEGERPSTRA